MTSQKNTQINDIPARKKVNVNKSKLCRKTMLPKTTKAKATNPLYKIQPHFFYLHNHLYFPTMNIICGYHVFEVNAGHNAQSH